MFRKVWRFNFQLADQAAVGDSSETDLDRTAGVAYAPPAMQSFSAQLLLILAILTRLWGGAACAAEPALVVLVNGNLIRGNVQQLDEHYRVQRAGGELLISHHQVEMVCHSLAEVYEKRRAQRTASSADTHIELARWCLRNDLYEYAQRELAAAAALESDHGDLPQLRRQLHQLIQLSQLKRAESASPVPPPVAETDPQLLDKAPPWARTLFVRQIQPILMQSCAAGGCHGCGAVAGAFELDRLANRGAGHAELTLKNLAAVLRHIDWDVPAQSRLLQQSLVTAEEQVADCQAAAMPPRQLAILRMWVEQLVTAEQQAGPAETFVTAAPTAGPPQATSPHSAVQLADHQRRDPFDPDFFNARYGGLPATPARPAASTAPARRESSEQQTPGRE